MNPINQIKTLGSSLSSLNKDLRWPRVTISLLLLATLIVYITGFFIELLGDSVLYGAISREMLSTGQWLEITRHGEPYLQKPPLFFWLTATSFQLFGISEVSFKLPNFLVTLFGLYAVFQLSKRLYDERTGWLSVLLLGISTAWFYYSNVVHTDSMLAVFIILTVWQSVIFIDTRRLLHLILAAISVGLALLTKGPVGLAIVVFALSAYLAHQRRWKVFLWWEWWLGAAIIVLMLLPYLWALHNQFGWDGPLFYFWYNIVGRISGEMQKNNTDLSYYLKEIIPIYLPWSLLALTALGTRLVQLFQGFYKKTSLPEALTLGGFVIYVIIISHASSKSPHFLLEILPFLAILTASWLIEVLDKSEKRWLYWATIAMQVVMATILWILIGLFLRYGSPSLPLLITLVILAAVTIAMPFLTRSRLTRVLGIAIPAVIAGNLTINVHLWPVLYQYNSNYHMTQVLNKKRSVDEMFYVYGLPKSYNGEIDFYSDHWATYINSLEFEPVSKAEGAWMYVTANGWRNLRHKYPNLKTAEIHEFERHTVLRPAKLLRAIAKNKPMEIRRLVKIKSIK